VFLTVEIQGYGEAQCNALRSSLAWHNSGPGLGNGAQVPIIRFGVDDRCCRPAVTQHCADTGETSALAKHIRCRGVAQEMATPGWRRNPRPIQGSRYDAPEGGYAHRSPRRSYEGIWVTP
jgi:hypothetical protein